MNEELKIKWLAALRSEDYTQGKDYLCKNNKFCCLGVLCDVIDSSKWVKSMFTPGAFGYIDPICMGGLPVHIGEKFNINSVMQFQLSSMNDNGYSFAEIADFIEENL